MKKLILILLCFTMLISTVSCNINNENDNLDTHTPNAQTTVFNTTDIGAPSTHIFGEWSVSKQVTEREDGSVSF